MSTLKIKRENGKIFCPLADSWHIETPEEKVRQEYIKILVEDYGYSLDQMAQEIKVNNSQRGQGKARADIVIWKSKQDKIESKAAFIVVECKADVILPFVILLAGTPSIPQQNKAHLPFDYSLPKPKSRCEYANFQIAHWYCFSIWGQSSSSSSNKELRCSSSSRRYSLSSQL